jgi:sulfonate transport system substrate-binding protein
VPPIWARAKGAPTVVVGITWVDEFQAIVTRPDSGIQSLQELKGKRLGLPLHISELVDHGRASALHGFVSALEIVGLQTSDVSFVDLEAPRANIREDKQSGVLSSGAQRGGSSVLSALREGVIDAAYIKGPNGIKQAREKGLHVLYDLTTHPDPLVHVNNAVPRPITVDKDLLATRPELIVRYLTVLLRVGQWAKTHPDEVRRLVAAETSSSEADTAIAYGPDLHHHLLPTLDDAVVAGLHHQKDFLRDWGFLPNDFDFSSWIVKEPLLEARRLVAALG